MCHKPGNIIYKGKTSKFEEKQNITAMRDVKTTLLTRVNNN